MKTFLTTMKGKIIAGMVTVAVIGAVAAVVIVMNSGYRTIAVEELNGITRIFNQGGTSDAYVGQHLKSGDDVTVTSESDMTLAMDTDKYMFAKENTHFWVEAKGKQSETRTKVHLDEGSTLCRIDNKLTSKESFEVETPNATMSVRGTVFRVSCYKDANGDTYTVIDVLEGEVFVQVNMENGESTGESRMLPAGKRAIVRSNPTFSEFVKIKDYEKIEGLINPKRPTGKNPGRDTTDVENLGEPEENTENVESGNGSGTGEDSEAVDEYVGDIDYSTFEQNEAVFLGKAVDEGRVLSISKELLYDIVELVEHDFSGKSEEVAATCEEDGYYYDICTICGLQGDKHISTEKLGHDYVAKGGDDTIEICKNCGKEIQKEIPIEVEPEEETVAEPVAPVVIEAPVNIPEAGDGTIAPVVEEPVVEEKEEPVEEEKKSSSSSSSSSSGGSSSSSSSGSSSSSSGGSSSSSGSSDPCANGHTGDWVDEGDEHTRTCTVCEQVESGAHQITTYTLTDATYHKGVCDVCNLQVGAVLEHTGAVHGDINNDYVWEIKCESCGGIYTDHGTVEYSMLAENDENYAIKHTVSCACGEYSEKQFHSFSTEIHHLSPSERLSYVPCACGYSADDHEITEYTVDDTGSGTGYCSVCKTNVTVQEPQ